MHCCNKCCCSSANDSTSWVTTLAMLTCRAATWKAICLGRQNDNKGEGRNGVIARSCTRLCLGARRGRAGERPAREARPEQTLAPTAIQPARRQTRPKVSRRRAKVDRFFGLRSEQRTHRFRPCEFPKHLSSLAQLAWADRLEFRAKMGQNWSQVRIG